MKLPKEVGSHLDIGVTAARRVHVRQVLEKLEFQIGVWSRRERKKKMIKMRVLR